jgi:hypothetical protein
MAILKTKSRQLLVAQVEEEKTHCPTLNNGWRSCQWTWAIENKNNTRRRPKWEVLHQFALGKSSSSFYFVWVRVFVRERKFFPCAKAKTVQFVLRRRGMWLWERRRPWVISPNFVQTLHFRYSFFISWWWITHVADELCRVPTKQSFVCVDSWLHRKSSVLSLCAPCYFYLLATSEFRSASGYTSKFFSK